MNGTIEILVAPDGAVTLKTSGFQGSECLAASRFLEETLGDVVEKKKTSGFFRTDQQNEQVQNS